MVAATDADLEAAVAAGEFRSPLPHRLAAYQIKLPPLRDRRNDFGRLFFHFLRLDLAEIDEPHRLTPAVAGGEPWVGADVMTLLLENDWPGNVRELRNVVRELRST